MIIFHFFGTITYDFVFLHPERLEMKERIEQVMTERGVTKRELARRLGILPQNVNVTIATENLSKMKQIAEAIGCDVTDFLAEPQPIQEINGYIEYEGEIYKIKSINDFNDLYNRINDGK